MRRVVEIMADWFRYLRSTASFKLLVIASALAALALLCVRFEDHKIVLLAWDIDVSQVKVFGSPPGRGIEFLILTTWLDTLPFLGFIVTLVATANVIPEQLRKGRIDAILARPVTRLQVVLGDFLGGLLMVTLVGTILVGGSWLSLAIRGEVFPPAWFLTIPILVAQYAILHAIAMLLGFWTRSTVASILLTLLFWFLGTLFCGASDTIRRIEMTPGGGGDLGVLAAILSGPAGVVIRGLYLIFPKITQVGSLTSFMIDDVMAGSPLQAILDAQPREAGSGPQQIVPPDWTVVAVSSVALVAVLLGLCTRILKRRDN